MGYVGNQTSNSYTSLDKQTITGDGGASYTLDHAVANVNEIEVFVNNVRQEPSVAYTVSGTALTMTGNVAASDDFYVVFQGKAIQTTVHPSGQPLQASTGSFTGNVDIQGNDLILDADGDTKIEASTDDVMTFDTAGSEAMRITSGGHLLVGKTTADQTNTVGFEAKDNGIITATVSDTAAGFFNRKGTSGEVVEFRDDNARVGAITVASGSKQMTFKAIQTGGSYVGMEWENGAEGLFFIGTNFRPGTSKDDRYDIGRGDARFDDIYATNSSIQTSDENEKQQIASLTANQITAAKAISKLFKTYKWNSSVTENGDNARTHTGVIAQQVATALTDAGLDPSDYAFYTSYSWTDDDGNSRTRLGIRYAELLSFIGAATEQRLADLETRVQALEDA